MADIVISTNVRFVNVVLFYRVLKLLYIYFEIQYQDTSPESEFLIHSPV